MEHHYSEWKSMEYFSIVIFCELITSVISVSFFIASRIKIRTGPWYFQYTWTQYQSAIHKAIFLDHWSCHSCPRYWRISTAQSFNYSTLLCYHARIFFDSWNVLYTSFFIRQKSKLHEEQLPKTQFPLYYFSHNFDNGCSPSNFRINSTRFKLLN